MNDRQQSLDRLRKLLYGMNIPEHRRESVKWLKKHLEASNGGHRNFAEAMSEVDLILKSGWA